MARIQRWHQPLPGCPLELFGRWCCSEVRLKPCGIVVIHRSRYRCVRVPLPDFTSFEGSCVRLHVGGESVTLLSIYRPGSCRPSTLFFEELRTVLEMLDLQPGPIILGGDINIHVEKEDDDDSVRCSELIESFNMIQHVVGPTHLHGGTLDLVATFSDSQLSRIIIDPAGMISDHNLVTAFMTVHHRIDPARICQVRSWKKVDLSAFREAIRESALANPTPTSTSSELFEIYDGCLRRIADRFAPEHTACSKVRPLSPWFDADCRAIRRNCRRLERCLYRRTKSAQDRAAWTAAVRQKHVDFLEKKNSYWSSRLSNESCTPSKVWKSMAKILRRDANQSTPPPSVLTADGFLKFFSDKVESVRSATGGHRPPEILFAAVTSLSNFRACTGDEARAIVMRSPSKSCSLDPIPTTILEECIDDLLPFLTAMCNASLLEGHLPVSQRHAIITPLIKKSNLDATDVKNYRLVSNLTFLSKVVERLVSELLVGFLQENNLMPVEQSAYRKHHSTETALLRVISDRLSSMDKQEVTLLGLLDLSAEFDCVDHDILLTRLERTFGITGSALNWIRSFLLDRTQQVTFWGQLSAVMKLIYGVPQSSVLGSLLFLLYTAELLDIIKKKDMKAHSYADDTQVHLSTGASNARTAVRRFVSCTEKIESWMSCNRLKINAEKTQVIWIGSRQQLAKVDTEELQLLSANVHFSTTVSNLGDHFDSQLTMRDHVTSTCRSCFFSSWGSCGPSEAHWRLMPPRHWHRRSWEVGLTTATVYYMVSARTSCDVCRVYRMRRQDSSLVQENTITSLLCFAWSSLVTSATKDNLQDRHFNAPVLERFGTPPPLPGDWLYRNLVDAWPKTVTICMIRTAIHSKNQDNYIRTKVVQGLWSHNLEWSACHIEGFFSEQKLFQKIA